MTYLLIVLAVCLILSSLMWIKPSSRQKLIAQMRSAAAGQGLQVRLSKAPDARPGEGRLDHALYLLAQQRNGPPPLPDWLLVKGSRRGDPSVWPGWRWMGREAPAIYQEFIAEALRTLPEDVIGLVSSSRGLGVFWQERGGLEAVETIVKTLTNLRSSPSA